MQKLVIDRTRWLRGETDSYLRRERDGKMCCVGFYCLANGYTEKDITNHVWPTSCFPNLPESLKWLGDCDRTWSEESSYALSEINDTIEDVSEGFRESEITAIFARNGVELEFIN